MEALLNAGQYITLDTLLVIIGATVFGLFVGAVPGLTATMAVALLVPFTFFMEPIPAVAMMIAVGASTIYAGDIPGALLRIPGTPASAAYVDDSYLLSQSGKTNLVLGLGLSSSVIGGIFGSVVLMVAAPVLAGFAIKFSSFEYTWLALLGLSCATLIAGQYVLKSLLALLLGLALATVGYDDFTGQARFTFGQISLLEGISFVPAMIGLFAISNAIEYYAGRWRNPPAPASTLTPSRSRFNILAGTGAVLRRHTLGMTRSSTIGTLIGVLPGAGADIAAWISYAVAKKCSREPENYGKGSEEALVNASTSNNASLAGSYIPTLVFGIPGDSVAAIVIGVLYMKDLQPGPSLFIFQPDKLYAIFLLFFIANLALLPLAMMVVNPLKRLTTINKDIIYPFVILFSIVGAFAVNNSMSAIVIMLLMGVLGYFLQKYHYPVAPIILGMVLGPLLEKNLLASLTKSDGDWLAFVERPVSAVLAALFFLVVVMQVRGIVRDLRRPAEK